MSEILPTRLRRAFNGWLRGLLAGQHFIKVLNLGCGYNLDKEGDNYTSYFDCNTMINVDNESEEKGYSDIKADAENLPFADNTFDFVFCNWAFYYMDREKVLVEIKRVLQPDGKIFISYWNENLTFVEETQRMLINTFDIIAFAGLHCDQKLDNRTGRAEAIFGTLRK